MPQALCLNNMTSLSAPVHHKATLFGVGTNPMLTCSNPPGQGGALHAGGAHAATAAPGPAAATQPTEPAWPEAGGQPTWRGAKGPEGPGRTPHLE